MSWQRPPIGAFLLWFRERAARKSTAPSGRSLLQSLHSRPSIRREVALILASGARRVSVCRPAAPNGPFSDAANRNPQSRYASDCGGVGPHSRLNMSV